MDISCQIIKKYYLLEVQEGLGKFLKKYYNSSNYFYPTSKELDICNIKSIEKFFRKKKPKLVIHCAALSRPMDIHEKKITKSININIIGTSNLVLCV